MSKDLSVRIEEKAFSHDGAPTKVLGRCHFDVYPGEFVVLVGQSGCGKSTLLRLLLALETDFRGSVSSSDRTITKTYPNRGVVFQEPRLLPWFTALQNVEFAMSHEHCAGASNKRERARTMLHLVGLEGFEGHLPRQLSGGMAQRTALARALVNMPDILLLDEPFAALDLHTRFRLQDQLLSVLEKTQTTTIMVTHDIDEALHLADRILVMSGRPGGIKAAYEVGVPKPRLRTENELVQLRKVLLDELVKAS